MRPLRLTPRADVRLRVCVHVCVLVPTVADPEQTLLERLEDLHKQLASVRDERQGAGVPGGGSSADEDTERATVASKSKLIVCSVRRPVKIHKSAGGGPLVYKMSTSPLTRAIHTLGKKQRVHWVSWQGEAIGLSDRAGVKARLEVGRARWSCQWCCSLRGTLTRARCTRRPSLQRRRCSCPRSLESTFSSWYGVARRVASCKWWGWGWASPRDLPVPVVGGRCVA